MTGFVYLIGAGCGEYDLITLRGLSALRKCDTVIYDALIDTSLLCFAPENARLICVGKRSGKHSAAQEEINALLTENALAGHTVARLKGGDPFVFGRGGEEIIQLQRYNIPFSVIPGISSCIAVPGLAGIPVTHRNISRELHVITAHTAGTSQAKQDFSGYAALEGTLVFLMGLSVLDRIAAELIRGGKSPDTPAAVICGGGTPEHKTVRGTLSDIAGKAAGEGCTAPAVITVGETSRCLFACGGEKGSVTVTGTVKFTEKLSPLLEAEGFYVRRYPHLVIEKKCEIPPTDGYDTIAFTSSCGAEAFLSHCRENRIDLRRLTGIKIAALGSGTAAALEAAGIIPDIIPEKYTAFNLGCAIAEKSAGRVLILRAASGSQELNRVLDERGLDYDDIKIYDTAVRNNLPSEAVRTDYLVFASSAGVRGFFDLGGTIAENTVIVCIGTPTADTARKYSENRIIIADPHTAQGAADAIKKRQTRRNKYTKADKEEKNETFQKTESE